MLRDDGPLVIAALANYWMQSYLKNGFGDESLAKVQAYISAQPAGVEGGVFYDDFLRDVRDLELVENCTRYPNGELFRYNVTLLGNLAERWHLAVQPPVRPLPAFLTPETFVGATTPEYYRSVVKLACADVAFSRAIVLVGYLLGVVDDELREHFQFDSWSDWQRSLQVGEFTASESDAGILDLSTQTTEAGLLVLRHADTTSTDHVTNLSLDYVVTGVSVGDRTIYIYRPNHGAVQLGWFKHVCKKSFDDNPDYYGTIAGLDKPLTDAFRGSDREAAFRHVLKLMETACKSATSMVDQLKGSLTEYESFVHDSSDTEAGGSDSGYSSIT